MPDALPTPADLAALAAFDTPAICNALEIDIVHADRHGAVVVPVATVRALPDAARLLGRREAKILAVARASGCTADRLIEAFGQADQIH